MAEVQIKTYLQENLNLLRNLANLLDTLLLFSFMK